MFLGMQDFYFYLNLIKFYPNFTKSIQIYQILLKFVQYFLNLSKFYSNFAQIDPIFPKFA